MFFTLLQKRLGHEAGIFSLLLEIHWVGSKFFLK